MDGFTEKKWFVYLGDHHEGPLSLADIQDKMAQSQVTPSNYVWRDGMSDWAVMTDVTEFEGLLQPRGAGNGAGAFSVQIEPTQLTEALSPVEPALDASPVVEPAVVESAALEEK